MGARRVVYLMSGAAHLPYLLVSLKTLRRQWFGQITVFAWPDSVDQVRRIAEDRRLYVDAEPWQPDYRGKNAQFISKIKLMRSGGDGAHLYLDADTMVAGDVAPLFERAEEKGFCATQFNRWVTTGSIVGKRIKRLIDREPVDQELVRRAVSESWPSVNGGVFAARPDSPVLPLWEEWTRAVGQSGRTNDVVFIADETVLHVVMLRFCPDEFAVAQGGAWNTSPKYMAPELSLDDVRIWHGHGDSFVRPQKSELGAKLWWPEWTAAVEQDLGGVREWGPAAVEQNKHLRRLEQPHGLLERR